MSQTGNGVRAPSSRASAEPAGDGTPDIVDWGLAVRTAERLLKPGPEVTRSEADAAVAALRRLADVADGHVRELTGLDPLGRTAPTRVIDRRAWVQANADGLAGMLTPLVRRLNERRAAEHGQHPGRLTTAIGSRVTGTEAGAVLAFLASRVLGQYDVFGRAGGELLLVAPNVVHVERLLGVDPSDFRLWVCLHECTHRLQFTAVPWLADHLHDEIQSLGDAIEIDPGVLRQRVRSAVRDMAAATRGGDSSADKRSGTGLLGVVQGPAATTIIDRITAVMSLVEGHAEYVMDAVGPEVVPSVAAIRSKFSARRRGTGPLDRVIRRVLGLDAKMRQYAEGGAFVREVVETVGMADFNAVWAAPENLPRRAEITAPADWIARVHGPRPATA